MSDVFISYSRKDREFVHKLHTALAGLNRDTWVDWEDIPPTSVWPKEIYTGIEAADTFVFVISPDSVTSKTCNEEIAHAVKNNKRIVPIMYRDVPDSKIPQPLRPINWIYFHDNDNFDIKFKELIQALDTDLDWVKSHTRLLVRAIEWENKNRNDSYVLRGKDLQEAEKWQSQAATRKEPRPTPLQSEYIFASRKSATRQVRVILSGVTIALLVAISFAIVAVFQWNSANLSEGKAVNNAATAVAESNARATEASVRATAEIKAVNEANVRATAEAKAVEQTSIAYVRQSSAQALNIAISRLDLGLLLGVEANRRTHLSDVHGSLLNALSVEPRLKKYLPGHPRGISNIALSPDGKILAAGTVDKTIILWDVIRGEPIGQPLIGHNSQVISLAFSPDGKILASGSNDPIFGLWDVSNPKTPRLITDLQSEPPSGKIVFTSDGRAFHIESGTDSYEGASLWNVPAFQPSTKNFTACSCGVLSLAFSPDGKTLALGSGDGHIELWNVPNRKIIKTFRYFTQDQFRQDGGILSLAFSPEGKWLASGSGRGYIRVWNLTETSDQPARVRYFGLSSVAKVAFVPNSSTLVYSNGTNVIYLWNLASGESYDLTVTRISSRVLSLAFSPDGKTLALGTSDNSIILWDLASRQPIGQPLKGHDSEVYSLAFNTDGKILVSGDWNHNIILWDLSSNQRLGVLLDSNGYWIPSVAFNPDGKTLASAVGMSSTMPSSIIIWDITNSPPISRSLAVDNDLQSEIIFSPNGKIMAASTQNSIFLWDMENKQSINKLNGSGENIAFSPDGQTLAASSAMTVTLWDVTTGRPRRTFSTGGEQVDSIAFSPDGRILASGVGGQNKPGKIILWNTENGQKIGQPLSGHTQRISSLAFSPDGKTLASGSWDKFIFLWDLTTRKVLDPPLEGQTDWITSIAFNPADGGQTLASGSMDGTVRLWDTHNHQQMGSPLNKYTGKINSIAYSPDGNWVAASGEGGKVVLWEVSLELWKARACSIANRNLSLTEWQQYLPSEIYQKTCPNLSIPPSLTESFLISEQSLIAAGKMKEALKQFEENFKLDPDLVTELEKAAKNFPVWNLAARGAELAQEGNLTDSMQIFQEIQYLGTPDRALAEPWNAICWYGGIKGHADEVKEVCEKAVSLAPRNGPIHDSRGLVRALTGDYTGAIEDFKFFIDRSKENDSYDSVAQKRQYWITELEAGRNPFNSATLESLRNE